MEGVWSVFLRLMKDYEALTMTEEEAYEIFQDNLQIALSSVQLKGVWKMLRLEFLRCLIVG